ncbi:MAG: DASS family sodium-coupled anion symporter [Candidatus Accumulibacter meliphilus]|jgi:sodium-dependent dicarboxylate transporter 2/3/5|uniref:SLC13 family permease n=1 Tax=Candidatus Accumulibacter meliphilus TaxID=2211374 RepID=UPI002FC3330E
MSTKNNNPIMDEGEGPQASIPISRTRLAAIVAGPVLMCVLLALPAPASLSAEAWRLVALAAWMVTWWMFEAVPVPVTALLPIPAMPLLHIGKEGAVAANYGNPLIFLFLGGFLIATAMQRWGLHRRIALNIVNVVGTSPGGIVAGFMLATAGLSMWISNTATTVMMYAVGLSVVEFVKSHSDNADQTRRFGLALMLGIAYSASIGGVGTLIGTPPNTLLASFLLENHGIQINFATWMLLGVPVVVVLLPLTWVLLCKLVYPTKDLKLAGAHDIISQELKSLGVMSKGERIVLVVFVITALLWITRSFLVDLTGLNISDTSIALFAATLLFALPASVEKGQFTVDWSVAKNVPWGVLLLFGGGLALAGAFSSTGLATAIGDAVGGLHGVEIGVIMLVTITAMVFLTELTSNTATTATFLPILGAVAVGMGVSPLALTIPAALAASMAFMMPVATPPNAIVFAYEEMRVQDMMKAGLWLNFVAIAVIYGAMLYLAPMVFDLGIG